MKYLAFDGKVFDYESECVQYEKINKLLVAEQKLQNHINENIGTTDCSGDGFSIIEPENVFSYILQHFDVISDLVKLIRHENSDSCEE